jgi:phenylacetate-CoA ligase
MLPRMIPPGARAVIVENQLRQLRQLLETILPANEFYRKKFTPNIPDIDSFDSLRLLPFTSKAELVEDQFQHRPYGTDLTFPLEEYIRVHQTSGTTGKPMYWLDTEQSWNWWAECWTVIYEAAGVGRGDRIYFAFSFGPFIGFWAGWEGARKLGALAVPGGGQSTSQRLRAMIDYGATVLVCTPTYALHMASEARKAGLNLARESAVRTTIHAGEPGASIPSTKKTIEEAWGAKCYDHAGATEVGAFAFECQAQAGAVHVNETEFIAEIIEPQTGTPVAQGEQGELVITNFGRIGSPIIRYRTGDLVKMRREPCPCGRAFMVLDGGVLGRVDDMVVIRGVNVFPSAIENVLREFPEIEEFRVEVYDNETTRELKLSLEPASNSITPQGLGDKVVQRVRECIGVRPRVEVVAPGTLPRFELKAKRFFKV